MTDIHMRRPIDFGAIKRLKDDLNKQYGEGTMYLGSQDPYPNITFISTGIPDLDWALGGPNGGLAQARISMIWGKEGSGKSSIAAWLAKQYPLTAFIDSEGTFTQQRGHQMGVDMSKMLVVKPENAESALQTMAELARAAVPLIILDSVPSLVPQREMETTDFSKQAGVAMTPGLLSKKLGVINNIIYKTGTAVLLVNQPRDNIGGFGGFGGERTHLPGGHALMHACSQIMKIGVTDKFTVSGDVVGQMIRVRLTKNKCHFPYREALLPYIYDEGFKITSNGAELKQLIKDARKRSLSRIREERAQMGASENPENDTENPDFIADIDDE